MTCELVIVSGKGGTGKTCITAAFSSLAGQSILCDADVDAADMHLLMAPKIEQTSEFMGGSLAQIRQEHCTECGRCRELCRFDAISPDFIIDPIGCEGCGVCVDLCPEQAIDFPVQKCGEWYISTTRRGPMVHARLGIAEENSGKLVSLIRQETRKLAEKKAIPLILTDGPPGIGCPVIATIGGATALVIIVEPTVSGLHDMQRIFELAGHFKVPGMLCVNKCDLNLDMTRQIESYATSRNVQLLGRIPFDAGFVKAIIAGQNIIEYAEKSAAAEAVRRIWQKIISSAAMSNQGIQDFRTIIN